jgi:hypothetical protein
VTQLQQALNERKSGDYMTVNDIRSSLYDTKRINAFEASLQKLKFQLQFFDQEERKLKEAEINEMLIQQQETTLKTQNESVTQTWSENEDKVSRKNKRRQQLLDHIFKDTSNVTERRLLDDDRTDYSILDSLDNTNEIQK